MKTQEVMTMNEQSTYPFAGETENSGIAIKTPIDVLEELFPGVADEAGPPFDAAIQQRRIGGEKSEVWVPIAINECYWANLLTGGGNSERPTVFDADEGRFIQYRSKSGCWHPVKDHELQTWLADVLKIVADECSKCDQVDTNKLMFQFRTNKVLSQIVTKAKGMGVVRSPFWKRSMNLLPVKNGVIQLDTMELLPHSADFHFRGVINVDFVPEATCPQYCAMLKAQLHEEDIDLLLRHAGMSIGGVNTAQMMLIISGPPRTGKGTHARILTLMMGPRNVGLLRTHLLDERFELSRLCHARLIYGGDVSSDFLREKGAQVLKSILGFDPMTFEWKNSNEVGEATSIEGCVLITANSKLLVRFEDDREAWHRRIAWINFVGDSVSDEKADAGLPARLLAEEGSGILNIYLQGLKKVRAAKGQLLRSEAQKKVVAELLDESESWVAFANECLEKAPAKLTVAAAYTHFVQFCVKRGWAAVTPRQFERGIKGVIRNKYGLTQSNDLGGRGWRGIRVIGQRGAEYEIELNKN